MIEFLNFARAVWRAYWIAKKTGIHYVSVVSHGVPVVTCIVATGREAWRVSDFALNVYRKT